MTIPVRGQSFRTSNGENRSLRADWHVAAKQQGHGRLKRAGKTGWEGKCELTLL
jgi:hypothetical protein